MLWVSEFILQMEIYLYSTQVFKSRPRFLAPIEYLTSEEVLNKV